MSTAKVIVYGASGNIGKLICLHLAERGIAFIATGRNKQRMEQQMKKLPELAKAKCEYVKVAHEQAALANLFLGKEVIVNAVGSSIQYGEVVVHAALESRCHYIDVANQQEWILYLKKEYGAAFEEKGLLLAPATSWMWTAGQMATELALETPGIDTLDVVYLVDSTANVSSPNSVLSMCCSEQKFLSNHQFCVWPHRDVFDISIPGDHRIYKGIPCGGAAEPVWYQDDIRIRNCSVLVAFKNQNVAVWMARHITDWFENYQMLSCQEQQLAFIEWGAALVNEELNNVTPELNRCVVSCNGRGNTELVSIVMRGNSPDIQTGVIVAEAVRRILIDRLYATGFASACEAFGHRELIASLAEEGYLSWEVRQGKH